MVSTIEGYHIKPQYKNKLAQPLPNS